MKWASHWEKWQSGEAVAHCRDGAYLLNCELPGKQGSCNPRPNSFQPRVSSEGPASEGLAFLKGLLRIDDLSVTSWLDARMLLASPEQALTHQYHVGGWDPCGYSQDLISKPPTVTSAQACASESPRPWVDGVGSAKKELLPGKPRVLVKTLCRLILGSLRPFFCFTQVFKCLTSSFIITKTERDDYRKHWRISE